MIRLIKIRLTCGIRENILYFCVVLHIVISGTVFVIGEKVRFSVSVSGINLLLVDD